MGEGNMFEPKISREFHSPEEQDVEVDNYIKGKPFDFYARYGSEKLEAREHEFSEMFGSADTALFNAGMAAINTAIEAEGLRTGDIVVCAKEMYEQTSAIANSLKDRGIEIVTIDPGNMEEIAEIVKSKKPRLILIESVANTQNMQVCNIKQLTEIAQGSNKEYQENLTTEKLLEKYFSTRTLPLLNPEKLQNLLLSEIEEFKQCNNPYIFREAIREYDEQMSFSGYRSESIREISKIVKYVMRNSREKLSLIIDNTLSSPALYNPLDDVKDSSVEAVIVESATKHYQEGQDKITMGVAYSNDAEKIKKIKAIRSMIGTYLQPVAENEIPDDIAKVMPEIMKRHAENTLKLAKMLSDSGKFIEVNHPNLPNHVQSELAQEIAPEGLVTLFYAKIKNAPEFVKNLKEIAGEKIGLGGSFGHSKTWVLNLGENIQPEEIRVAVGSESPEEFEELLKTFQEALDKTGE